MSSSLDFLNIDGYNIAWSDQPSFSKRGGVWCNFNKSLLIRVLKINLTSECLVLEMICNNKLVIISVIYCFLSQLSQEFTQFGVLFTQFLNDITPKTLFSLF